MPAHVKIWSRRSPPKRLKEHQANTGFIVSIPKGKQNLPLFCHELLEEKTSYPVRMFGGIEARAKERGAIIIVTNGERMPQ